MIEKARKSVHFRAKYAKQSKLLFINLVILVNDRIQNLGSKC